jgi:2-polyprenyl-3-methyl-5-hydroxy-6-metoxy-1,4-benzoquinol methylase
MKNNVVEFIQKNLRDFTGLNENTFNNIVSRKGDIPGHKKEWKFWDPKTADEINWYYYSSRSYVFANSIHVFPKQAYDYIDEKSSVLDFGGGAGHISVALSKNKQCKVHYFDIGIIQREFVKYMSEKNNLNIEVVDMRNFYPVFSNCKNMDYVVSYDVFEHIPDYRKVLKDVSNCIKIGGEFVVNAPFGSSEPSHFKDKFDFKRSCEECGLQYIKNVANAKIFKKV